MGKEEAFIGVKTTGCSTLNAVTVGNPGCKETRSQSLFEFVFVTPLD